MPWTQDELRQRGHAMQVRVYAEDPGRSLPAAERHDRAVRASPSGPGVRVDAGVMRGSEIGVKFDPMLSKLICYAEDRDTCIDRIGARCATT